jgi:diamine N-acetyltransferase
MNDHITLRAMEPEDLDLLYQIENDRQLWDVGSANVPYSRYILYNYIASSSGDIYSDHQVRLIIENGVGETVGIADVINFDTKNLRAEVGIVIAREHRQKGYAGQTLVKLSEYAMQVLHLHQLYAIVDLTNTISLQVFKNAGYEQYSVLKDWLYDGKKYRDAVLMQIFF